jgi:uncharacterized protein (DUF1697 family)
MEMIVYQYWKLLMEKIDYLALLRGINVGGNNIIKMNELYKLFESMNYTDIKTYIQSGNVMFKDSKKEKLNIRKIIEKTLFEKMGNEIKTLILTFREIESIYNNKPDGFAEEKATYKYDVIFLIDPLTTKEMKTELSARHGVDEIYEGKNIFYIKRSIKKLSSSYLTKMIRTPMWQNITVRNWNTTEKLYELM